LRPALGTERGAAHAALERRGRPRAVRL